MDGLKGQKKLNSQGLQKRSHVKRKHIFFAYYWRGVPRRTARLGGQHVHRTRSERGRLARDLISSRNRRCLTANCALIGRSLRFFGATLSREGIKFALRSRSYSARAEGFRNCRIMASFHMGIQRRFLSVTFAANCTLKIYILDVKFR